MMTRLRHLQNTLQTNWSSDPALRGAAKVAAGTVLIIEGLFGPIRAAKAWVAGNTSSVSGIAGNILGVLVGLALLIGPALVNDDPAGELLEAPGIVSGVFESHDPDGEVVYGAIYTYEVERQTFEIRSSSRSSTRPVLGTEVTIGYPETDPAGGRRVDGIEGNLLLILQGIGALVLLAALLSLAISVALVVVGIRLLHAGRRDRSEVEDSAGVIADLVSLVRTADRTTLDIAATAAGVPGQGQGSGSVS
jgi:hypothetical protein